MGTPNAAEMVIPKRMSCARGAATECRPYNAIHVYNFDPKEIEKVKVVLTIAGGQIVHQAR